MVIESGRSISGGHFSREIDGTRVTSRLMLMLSGAEIGVTISNTPEMLQCVIVEDIDCGMRFAITSRQNICPDFWRDIVKWIPCFFFLIRNWSRWEECDSFYP